MPYGPSRAKWTRVRERALLAKRMASFAGPRFSPPPPFNTMDDIVLLARTRWELRRAIAALHEEIAALRLRLHRVKRFVGRTTHGFDFLGYRIRAGVRLRPSAEGLGLSEWSPS